MFNIHAWTHFVVKKKKLKIPANLFILFGEILSSIFRFRKINVAAAGVVKTWRLSTVQALKVICVSSLINCIVTILNNVIGHCLFKQSLIVLSNPDAIA